MDGTKEDESRIFLGVYIINTIARGKPNKAVIRDVDLVSDTNCSGCLWMPLVYLFSVQVFQRSGKEEVPALLKRFKGMVAKYINQIEESDEFSN